MKLRDLLRDLTPPLLLRAGRHLLPCSTMPHETVEQHTLRLSHETLNAESRRNSLFVRPGIQLRLHPESIWGVEHFCFISPSMVEELDCFIALTKKSRCLLDIGALHGLFSLVFAITHPHGRALAIDASPLAFAKLLYNIHVNELSNIEAVECAVSKDAGVLRMHMEWEHAVAAGTQQSSTGTLEINKRTADDVCFEHRLQPDVIKIDVEGHERKVLQGLSQTIASQRPVVFLEIHPLRLIEEGDSTAQIAEFFFNHGYTSQLPGGRVVTQQWIEGIRQDQRLVFLPPSTDSC